MMWNRTTRSVIVGSKLYAVVYKVVIVGVCVLFARARLCFSMACPQEFVNNERFVPDGGGDRLGFGDTGVRGVIGAR